MLEQRVFGDEVESSGAAPELSRERVRQLGKRASRLMAELAAVHPRFQIMADTLTAVPEPGRPSRRPAPVRLVANNPVQPHAEESGTVPSHRDMAA